jgi:ribosome-binding factor A
MAVNQDRRRQRVASILQRAVSEVIHREFSDPRFAGAVISVTRVEPAPDLKSAKVHISVMGSDAQQRTVWRALAKARGLIQSLAADKTTLRWTPELLFREDPSIKKAFAVNELIKQAMAETDPAAAAAEQQDQDAGELDDGELGEGELGEGELDEDEPGDDEPGDDKPGGAAAR